MPQTVETLIIGGVIGSALAYHLARASHSVLVVERVGIAEAPAASWASAGGVRRQGPDPAEAALASAAIARWPTLEAELGADLHYRQGGQLLLAETDDEAAQLVAFVAQQQALGFADVRLVQGAELRELVPGLAPAVLAGSYSPADGQADPTLTTRAFAAAAQRAGAQYWTHTTCLALRRVGDRVVGAQTANGEVPPRRRCSRQGPGATPSRSPQASCSQSAPGSPRCSARRLPPQGCSGRCWAHSGASSRSSSCRTERFCSAAGGLATRRPTG